MDEQKSVKNRKWIVLTAELVALLGMIVAIVLFALMPRSAASDQEKNYNEAKRLISIGQYEKAYFLLRDCVTAKYDGNLKYYKDTGELLSDFRVFYREITRFNENGEMTYKSETICQEELGKVTNITDLCNGSAPTSYSEEYKDGNLVLTYDAGTNMTKEYEYDQDGNKIVCAVYRSDGAVIRNEYEYDQYGNQVAHYKNNEKVEWYEYQYDKDGNVLSKTVSNSSNSAVSRYTYAYDQYGNVTSYITDGSQGYSHLEVQYDKNGNEIGRVSYDEGGNKIYSREIQYDRNGNYISLTIRNASGDVYEKTQWKYDKNGNCIRSITYDENNKVTQQTEWTHDQKGNVLSKVTCDADGNPMSSYKALYDANGTRIWCADYDAEGKVVSEQRWSDYTIVYLPAFGK